LHTAKLWIRIGGTIMAVAMAGACGATATAGQGGNPRRHPTPAASGPASSGAPGGVPSAGPTPGTSGQTSGTGDHGAALPTLTAQQMAGQRVIYSYRGLTPPPGLLRLIRHGEAAGVIFFADNVSGRAQIGAVVRELSRADASKLNPVRWPLLLMTDQEGGQVRRLPGPPALSEKQIGSSARPAGAAASAGSSAAKDLLSMGMNVNLAPVLDVYRKPGGFVDQFGRSYSSSPHVVSGLGADFTRAQQAAGVAATAKHFPGLGAAARSQDTDAGPVTLQLSRATVRGVDELPYQAVISAKVKLIMLSWAVYPALDGARPAGLSRAVVQGELRQRLGFGGVTITDALGAGALAAFGSISRRGQLAAAAGMDLLLCSGQTVGEGEHAMRGLSSGYRNGTLGRAPFIASLRRVLALRAALAG
jgi:beta-N-acetylhexosaminidase